MRYKDLSFTWLCLLSTLANAIPDNAGQAVELQPRLMVYESSAVRNTLQNNKRPMQDTQVNSIYEQGERADLTVKRSEINQDISEPLLAEKYTPKNTFENRFLAGAYYHSTITKRSLYCISPHSDITCNPVLPIGGCCTGSTCKFDGSTFRCFNINMQKISVSGEDSKISTYTAEEIPTVLPRSETCYGNEQLCLSNSQCCEGMLCVLARSDDRPRCIRALVKRDEKPAELKLLQCREFAETCSDDSPSCCNGLECISQAPSASGLNDGTCRFKTATAKDSVQGQSLVSHRRFRQSNWAKYHDRYKNSRRPSKYYDSDSNDDRRYSGRINRDSHSFHGDYDRYYSSRGPSHYYRYGSGRGQYQPDSDSETDDRHQRQYGPHRSSLNHGHYRPSYNSNRAGGQKLYNGRPHYDQYYSDSDSELDYDRYNLHGGFSGHGSGGSPDPETRRYWSNEHGFNNRGHDYVEGSRSQGYRGSSHGHEDGSKSENYQEGRNHASHSKETSMHRDEAHSQSENERESRVEYDTVKYSPSNQHEKITDSRSHGDEGRRLKLSNNDENRIYEDHDSYKASHDTNSRGSNLEHPEEHDQKDFTTDNDNHQGGNAFDGNNDFNHSSAQSESSDRHSNESLIRGHDNFNHGGGNGQPGESDKESIHSGGIEHGFDRSYSGQHEDHVNASRQDVHYEGNASDHGTQSTFEVHNEENSGDSHWSPENHDSVSLKNSESLSDSHLRENSQEDIRDNLDREKEKTLDPHKEDGSREKSLGEAEDGHSAKINFHTKEDSFGHGNQSNVKTPLSGSSSIKDSTADYRKTFIPSPEEAQRLEGLFNKRIEEGGALTKEEHEIYNAVKSIVRVVTTSNETAVKRPPGKRPIRMVVEVDEDDNIRVVELFDDAPIFGVLSPVESNSTQTNSEGFPIHSNDSISPEKVESGSIPLLDLVNALDDSSSVREHGQDEESLAPNTNLVTETVYVIEAVYPISIDQLTKVDIEKDTGYHSDYEGDGESGVEEGEIGRIEKRYDQQRRCHQAKDKCRRDEQCCINLECHREKPTDKYGRCRNMTW